MLTLYFMIRVIVCVFLVSRIRETFDFDCLCFSLQVSLKVLGFFIKIDVHLITYSRGNISFLIVNDRITILLIWNLWLDFWASENLYFDEYLTLPWGPGWQDWIVVCNPSSVCTQAAQRALLFFTCFKRDRATAGHTLVAKAHAWQGVVLSFNYIAIVDWLHELFTERRRKHEKLWRNRDHSEADFAEIRLHINYSAHVRHQGRLYFVGYIRSHLRTPVPVPGVKMQIIRWHLYITWGLVSK